MRNFSPLPWFLLVILACEGGLSDENQVTAVATRPTANVTPSGMPCEVSQLLGQHCTSCHSDPPLPSVPGALVTREQLMMPSPSDVSKTNAQASVSRMRSMSAPMPPGGLLPNATTLAFEAWIAAGYPEGTCDTNTTPLADPAFEGDPTCKRQQHWPAGAEEYAGLAKKEMEPGEPCDQCHDQLGEGPRLHIAGTVYPTGHDDRRCFGIDGNVMSDVRIVVTGADGVELTLVPNRTGNFYSKKIPVAKPYRAKVISSKGERVMQTAASEADCNLCHTAQGAGPVGQLPAPGRIVIPW